MQIRDEVEGLHNCRECTQPLDCLYQAMQTQEKSFEKITEPFVMVLIKREILTSCKVVYTKACTRNQFLFRKLDALQNTDFSRLKCQLKRK